MSISRIGLDTAKAVFQVHGIDETGKAIMKRKLQRSEMIPFFEKLGPCTIYLEACGAGHYWARVLIGLGHDVKLIAPEAVTPFVKKGKKNDPADAAAVCEAGGRPNIKFVPVKTVEQQAILAVHSVRALLSGVKVFCFFFKKEILTSFFMLPLERLGGDAARQGAEGGNDGSACPFFGS